MIDYVYGGEYMNVTSNKGATPYVTQLGTPMVGSITYDSSTQSTKVFDGYTWQILGGGSAMINLNPTAISILKWAESKMREEQEMQDLCIQHPTIKDIVDQMNSSIAGYQSKIEMIKILIKEEKSE